MSSDNRSERSPQSEVLIRGSSNSQAVGILSLLELLTQSIIEIMFRNSIICAIQFHFGTAETFSEFNRQISILFQMVELLKIVQLPPFDLSTFQPNVVSNITLCVEVHSLVAKLLWCRSCSCRTCCKVHGYDFCDHVISLVKLEGQIWTQQFGQKYITEISREPTKYRLT